MFRAFVEKARWHLGDDLMRKSCGSSGDFREEIRATGIVEIKYTPPFVAELTKFYVCMRKKFYKLW